MVSASPAKSTVQSGNNVVNVSVVRRYAFHSVFGRCASFDVTVEDGLSTAMRSDAIVFLDWAVFMRTIPTFRTAGTKLSPVKRREAPMSPNKINAKIFIGTINLSK